jgi:hypothetical protein
MIKRISFAAHGDDLTSASLAANAPSGVRPSRVVACTILPELTGPDPRHGGVVIEWFADPAHLRRFQDWNGHSVPWSPVIVAEEAVLRGAGWLDRRWRDGGDRLKHMALAVRAAGLTPAEFSRAWRGRAGQVRRAGTTQVTAIPDEVRGRAYVQNHPDLAGERAYDAVNEVWFDDLAGLRARVEWFRANLPGPTESGSAEVGPAEADLIRQSWFIAVREHVVLA